VTSVVVIGAGALGSAYGACLAQAGADVQLLAREPHVRAITEAGGIALHDGDAVEAVALRAEWRSEKVTPAEIAILLTKGHDSAAALDSLRHLLPDLRVAVSLQNGVVKDRVLAGWCGPERVAGGASLVGATLERPGTVTLTSRGITYFGPGVEPLPRLLRDAGLEAVVTEQVEAVEWAKLVQAEAVMTITALTGKVMHAALLDPDLAELFVGLVREAGAVAAASGVELQNVQGLFPLRSIAAAGVELVHEAGRALEARGATNVRISMLEDVRRGRRLEIDDVHGFLIAEAERLGVSVPLTRVSFDLLSALDRTRTAAPR
jgi:2-dehydropantoate 2-reductase